MIKILRKTHRALDRRQPRHRAIGTDLRFRLQPLHRLETPISLLRGQRRKLPVGIAARRRLAGRAQSPARTDQGHGPPRPTLVRELG